MGALVIGGFAQELLLLIGHPQFGVAITIPLVILVAWLWRPPWAVLGIIGVGLGIELLLPLQTGGGRYQDWLLHYQMTLHYAGQPSHVPRQRSSMAHAAVSPAQRWDPRSQPGLLDAAGGIGPAEFAVALARVTADTGACQGFDRAAPAGCGFGARGHCVFHLHVALEFRELLPPQLAVAAWSGAA